MTDDLVQAQRELVIQRALCKLEAIGPLMLEACHVATDKGPDSDECKQARTRADKALGEYYVDCQLLRRMEVSPPTSDRPS